MTFCSWFSSDVHGGIGGFWLHFPYIWFISVGSALVKQCGICYIDRNWNVWAYINLHLVCIMLTRCRFIFYHRQVVKFPRLDFPFWARGFCFLLEGANERGRVKSLYESWHRGRCPCLSAKRVFVGRVEACFPMGMWHTFGWKRKQKVVHKGIEGPKSWQGSFNDRPTCFFKNSSIIKVMPFRYSLKIKGRF